MCELISAITAGITAAAHAIGGALTAAGGAIMQGVANVGFGMIGAVGGSSAIAATPTAVGVGLGAATIAGGVAAVGAAAYSLHSAYQNARQSQKRQQEYNKAVQEAIANQGQPETNKAATGIQDNSRVNRTLSSLRVSMLPQKQTTEEITQNVYGVDTNSVTSPTQNMLGLNIATV